MPRKSTISKELLFTYFEGRATTLQKQMVEQWLTKPENEEYFYACLHEWETMHPQYAADLDKALNRFNKSVAEPAATSPVVQIHTHDTFKASPIQFPIRRWLAAACALLALCAFAWIFQNSIWYKCYSTGYGETCFIELNDGSQVALNANSTLTVPRFGFGKVTRDVFLKGEANFAVVHTPDDQRFIVHTDSTFKVEVLGTEFTVFARERQTRVVLSKGKIKVQYGQTEQDAEYLTMEPGDLVLVNKKEKELQVKKTEHPENHASWKENRFVFENTSIKEIKNILHENYGLTVDLKGRQLTGQTISGSFQAHNANELLEALSEILDINVIRQDKHVVIYSKQ
jgi:transmembrane sensor